MRLLIEQCGADVHAEDDYALRWAAKKGHIQVVKYLIEQAGADVHAKNDLALRWAARNGHIQVVKYLIQFYLNEVNTMSSIYNIKLNFFHSVKVPLKEVLLWESDAFTVKYILKEENVEKRRVMILYYGLEKFLQDGGAKICKRPVSKDDYQDALIYELELSEGTHYFLMLKNQTIEPGASGLTVKERVKRGLTEDGYKKYFLGIDNPDKYPTMYDAVGSTFGLGIGEYRPDVEA